MSIDWTQDASCEAAWLMNADEDPLTDSSGNGRTAALKGTGEPNYTASGKFGGAYQFDTNDYALTADLNLGAGTYSWVTYGYLTTLGNAYYVDFRDSGVGFFYYSNTDNLEPSSGTEYVDGVANNASIVRDAWAHYAMAGASLTVEVITIGSRYTLAEGFNGTMDETALFSTTLDSTDISDIMDNGLAGTQFYTSGDVAALPSDDTDLENQFTVANYTTVSADNATRVTQTATGEYAIFQFKDKHTNNTDSITVTWNGQSDLAPSTSPLILQVYNHTTGTWVELDRNDDGDADTDYTLTGSL